MVLDPDVVTAHTDVLAGATLHLTNRTTSEHELRLDVDGTTAGWAWVTPPVVTLGPGGSTVARVTFRAPRAGEPLAGPTPFAVTATSTSANAASASGTLVIQPFVDLFATLSPSSSRGGRSVRRSVTIHNRANAGCTAELDVSSIDADDVQLAIDPPSVTVEPGDSAHATVIARRAGLGGRRRAGAGRIKVSARVGGVTATTVEASLPSGGGSHRSLARGAAGVAAVVATAALARATALSPTEPIAQPSDEVAVAGTVPACPAEGHLGSAEHGRVELPPYGYSFLYADDEGCLPARFDPCQPVHYVVNDTLAPPGAVDDVRGAIARVAEATGISFVDGGTTDEPLTLGRSAYQPERYGERWAPILIGWSTLGEGEGVDAAGDDIIVAGRGRPLRVGNVLVSGVLELNADVIVDRVTEEELPGGFGAGITRGRVLLHELGHVMGLGHAGNPAQLMYPELAEQTSSTATFGVGDATGLRLIGRDAGCVEDPPVPGPPTG